MTHGIYFVGIERVPHYGRVLTEQIERGRAELLEPAVRVYTVIKPVFKAGTA